MDNTGYTSEADGRRMKLKPTEDHDAFQSPHDDVKRKDWSTPVGLAVAATNSDFIEDTLEATLDGEFLREGDFIGSDSERSGFAEDPYIYTAPKTQSSYQYPRHIKGSMTPPGVSLPCT